MPRSPEVSIGLISVLDLYARHIVSSLQGFTRRRREHGNSILETLRSKAPLYPLPSTPETLHTHPSFSIGTGLRVLPLSRWRYISHAETKSFTIKLRMHQECGEYEPEAWGFGQRLGRVAIGPNANSTQTRQRR